MVVQKDVGNKMNKYFQYYQPNKKDIKDKFGDCTIRALSKAWNCTWVEAFDKMIPICREYQTCNIFNVPIALRKEIFEKLGFTYSGVSNKKGNKRPTVESFAKDNPKGTYIANVANHVVAIVDGKYYDTWDSGKCCLYGYFKKGAEE